MTKRELLVVYPTLPPQMAQLEETYTLHRYDQAEDKAAFIAEHGPKCEGVVINGHASFRREHLQQMPNLRIVACSSAGFEDIDVDALTEAGVHFTNTSDALFDDVADCALMLTLACRRHLVAGHDYVKTGAWGRQGMYPLTSALRGKKAGIAGLGTIGKAIARRFEPLGLELGYMARSKKDVPYTYHADIVSLAEWSDILIVIVPGGPETEGMINADVCKALGPKGTLINVARGSVVNETDLIAALKDGSLGDAGLDVYLNEPNPNPDLTGLPNVTLYPHHASGTVETRDAMAQLVVDNLAACFAGKPLLTPVNDVKQSAASA